MKTIFSGRHPLMEDYIWWKTTFGWKRPLGENDHQWKTIFRGRQPLVEDNLWCKTTFGEIQPWVEDDLWWKTTCGGRWPLVEYNLFWKTTFGGRQPWAEDDLWWILACYLVRFAAFFSPSSTFKKLISQKLTGVAKNLMVKPFKIPAAILRPHGGHFGVWCSHKRNNWIKQFIYQ